MFTYARSGPVSGVGYVSLGPQRPKYWGKEGDQISETRRAGKLPENISKRAKCYFALCCPHTQKSKSRPCARYLIITTSCSIFIVVKLIVQLYFCNQERR